jgi:LPS sulfotransferase NodH
MFKRFKAWLVRQLNAPEIIAACADSTGATALNDHENLQGLVPYDENLLERSRTQWQFGDWASLAAISRDTLQHHPDRAKLALLCAAGHSALGNPTQAHQYIRLAIDWGCSKRLISQILISGVHNTLGLAVATSGQAHRAEGHFEKAITIGTPGAESKLLTQARKSEQLKQLEASLFVSTSKSPSRLHSKNIDEIQTSTLRSSESSTTIKVNRNVVDREIKKIPPEDLVNAKFDSSVESTTTNILIIFSTPRCGSTLLCEILEKNSICVAHEYFQPYQYMPLLADRWKCIDKDFLDPEAYISALCRYRTLPNGWLGINLHSSHISIFDRMLKQFPKANFTYIHLMRRDTLSQAISYALARQTDQWSSHFESVAEAKYDFKMISNLYSNIVDGNALIGAYISMHNIECSAYYYDDLIGDPIDFFQNLSAVIPQVNSIKYNSTLNRQATDLNVEWANRYKEDLYMTMLSEKMGSIEFIA